MRIFSRNEIGENYYQSAGRYNQKLCMDEMEKMMIETLEIYKKTKKED